MSRDEALADYLYDNDTVTYDVVAFDPNNYRAVMHLTDADLKRFLDGHAAEVEARYKADATLYKGVKPQLSIREIFIPKAFPVADKKPDDKKPDDKAAADKKPGSNTAENPRGLPLDAAKAKLEAVRAQIAAGKLKFIDAEKQLAADSLDDSPQDNGDRGWMPADTVALGDKEINDATKTLKPGELSPVVVTDRGSYLVTVVDKREGDLSFDQVKARDRQQARQGRVGQGSRQARRAQDARRCPGRQDARSDVRARVGPAGQPRGSAQQPEPAARDARADPEDDAAEAAAPAAAPREARRRWRPTRSTCRSAGSPTPTARRAAPPRLRPQRLRRRLRPRARGARRSLRPVRAPARPRPRPLRLRRPLPRCR